MTILVRAAQHPLRVAVKVKPARLIRVAVKVKPARLRKKRKRKTQRARVPSLKRSLTRV